MLWVSHCRACLRLLNNRLIKNVSRGCGIQSHVTAIHTSSVRYPRRQMPNATSEPSKQSQRQDPQLPSHPDSSDSLNPGSSGNPQSDTRVYQGIDPRDTSVLMFPGQGSQFVGMGKNLLQYPGVREIYDSASDILNYDLLDLCLSGPIEKLNQTVHCQPAVMVTSLAALESLKHTNPWAIEHCVSACGFSVGEFAALIFSGSLSFQDGVKLIKTRAETMQQISTDTPSAMATVYISHKTKLNLALLTARRYCAEDLKMESPVCDIANYLYPECKVIAGHIEAIDFLERHSKEFGISRMRRLPVSGAFHTNIMKPVKRIMNEQLRDLDLQQPIVPVHSNMTGKRYGSISQLRRGLGEQVYRPVLWEQTLHTMFSRPTHLQFPHVYELGPGRQLGALLKRVNAKAHANWHPVDV